MRDIITPYLADTLRDRNTAPADLETIFNTLDLFHEDAANLAVELLNEFIADTEMMKVDFYQLYAAELKKMNLARAETGKAKIKGPNKDQLGRMIDHLCFASDSINRIRQGLTIRPGFPGFSGDRGAFFKKLADRVHSELLRASHKFGAEDRFPSLAARSADNEIGYQ